MSGKDTDRILGDISKKIDVLIRLSALNLVNNKDSQKDKILILDETGFTPKQIAEIVKTSSGTVSQTLYEIRKEREPKVKKDTIKEKNTEPMPIEEKKDEPTPA
jgi:hypothetical protein